MRLRRSPTDPGAKLAARGERRSGAVEGSVDTPPAAEGGKLIADDYGALTARDAALPGGADHRQRSSHNAKALRGALGPKPCCFTPRRSPVGPRTGLSTINQ